MQIIYKSYDIKIRNIALPYKFNDWRLVKTLLANRSASP